MSRPRSERVRRDVASPTPRRGTVVRYVLYALVFLAGCWAGLWLSDGAPYQLVAGPPDLGRADFAAGNRPSNQFVACAAADTGCREEGLTLAVVETDPATLVARVEAVASRQPRTVRVDDGSDPLHRRYVQRSPLMRFPDTVSVDAVPVAGGTALRVSSRAQLGVDDFGANEDRVRRWLAALDGEV